jgi:hypothetical protein
VDLAGYSASVGAAR